MDVTVYIEYENDENSFNTLDNYYSDDNSYAIALSESYNQTKDAINESMINGFQKNVMYFNQLNNVKQKKINDKHYYASCEATLLTEDLNNEIEEDFINKINSKNIFINVFNFNFDTSDEEFETEFKMWITTHKKINLTNQSDEWKFQNEPKRDLRIKFLAKNNKEYFLLLQNCKVIDNLNNNCYAILIERISFIKQI